MAKVLIIDDNKTFCDALSDVIRDMGHDVTYSLSLEQGINESSSKEYDVVFLDVRLPDGNGLDVLPEIQETPSSPEVIIITGEGDPDGAELAIKSGAWDYLEKPSSLKEIRLPLTRALQYRQEKQSVKPPLALKRDKILGDSRLMKECFELLAQAADSRANVLITGETGTGKELFARAIHTNSPLAKKKFIVVDCASIPESLVESTLFGYKKGAFTGAHKGEDGLIKQADGGTLFLDEVGELPLPMQRAFLRVLQERHFRPLGAKEETKSNFRLLAATNQNLDQSVRRGQFREDLLFRLKAITIDLPPLRKRPEDIKQLISHYVTKLCETYRISVKQLSSEFLEILMRYDWPGNVRELINTLDRAIAAARSDNTLFSKHLPTHIRVYVARSSFKKEARAHENQRPDDIASESLPTIKDFRDALIKEGEKRYLKDLMSLTGGNLEEARKISGLGRARLYGLLKEHNISRTG
ncbi:MAG: sigma-54 dependent transcriptional regulator [Thermodesulfobacteriota bacterium]|nr:sigma-54 dependent transcriptional regulator [Thermodesulfobacteriota bacterium]